MIICVSIVDKHKPKGQGHVGTYLFEIDRVNDSHFDFMMLAVPAENEHIVRPQLGRLLRKGEMADPVDGFGNAK